MLRSSFSLWYAVFSTKFHEIRNQNFTVTLVTSKSIYRLRVNNFYECVFAEVLKKAHRVIQHTVVNNVTLGAIHATKIPTGPTGKSGPPQKEDPFFRNFSGWTEPIHWVLDRNVRKFWLNRSRPFFPIIFSKKMNCAWRSSRFVNKNIVTTQWHVGRRFD